VIPQPKWIDKRALLLLHEESLAMFGGARGLRDEGKRLRVDQVNAIQTMLALAAGTLDEDGLAVWIRGHA
jgi:prophage maintenance system killer protein